MHHDVLEFRGEHRWLSNFWEVPGGIPFGGITVPTVEHAYQASKALRLDDARLILAAPDAGTAKHLGQSLAPEQIFPDWHGRKLRVMGKLTRLKYQEPGLRAELLGLGPGLIVEGNRWHDTFYGVCLGSKSCDHDEPVGENNLGRLLMAERARLIAERTFAAREGGQ